MSTDPWADVEALAAEIAWEFHPALGPIKSETEALDYAKLHLKLVQRLPSVRFNFGGEGRH